MQLTVDLHNKWDSYSSVKWKWLYKEQERKKKKALGKFTAIHASIFRNVYTRVWWGVQTIVGFEWIINVAAILSILTQKSCVVSMISLNEHKSCQLSTDENTIFSHFECSKGGD